MLDVPGRIQASYQPENHWSIVKARMRSFTLVILFAFCQIAGAMCTVPDISLFEDTAQLVEEMSGMACPMDSSIMCPPSLTASPERQIKHAMVDEANPVLSLIHHPIVPTDVSVEMIWSWSSAYSLVPLSIGSSPVLRI